MDRMVAPSLEIVTSCRKAEEEISQQKRCASQKTRTPMLSTSILSNPKGPKELFTMFAMD